MKFLFDEQLPKAIVIALDDTERAAHHVVSEGLGGYTDEAVIDYAGQRGWCFVTADNNILRKPQIRAAIYRCKVGVFFFTGKAERDRFGWLQLIVARLDQMERFASEHEPPYCAQVPDRGAIKLLKVKADRKR